MSISMTDDTDENEQDRLASEAIALAEEIGRNHLAGRGEFVQGAVLAELLARWLAGHFPRDFREELLAMHIDVVRQLILPNEAQVLEMLRSPKGEIGI